MRTLSAAGRHFSYVAMRKTDAIIRQRAHLSSAMTVRRARCVPTFVRRVVRRYTGMQDTGELDMDKIILHTDRAPAAVGPYSQAVRTGNLVFSSGQIGLDPRTGKLAGPDLETQARQAFANLAAIAEAAGASLANAIKLTLFLTDLANFSTVNAIMAESVPKPYPSRTTIGVASLPLGALFEVEAILML